LERPCNEYNSKNRNYVRELLNEHKELLENFQLLLTISGIGKESAVAILAEVSDIETFRNARQLCNNGRSRGDSE
jgi:transposase